MGWNLRQLTKKLCLALRVVVSGVSAASIVCAQMFVAAIPAYAGQALPTGGSVVVGTATITNPASGRLLIDQSSNKAIIEWGGFSIGAGKSVHFNNGSGATLNRVTGSSISQIDGSLTSTGDLFLINKNGVIIGRDGVVQTGGSFVASTLDIANDDFLNGGDSTFAGSSDASVVNLGKVSSLGGDVAFIAHTVVNEGEINALNGTVGLAAGREILLRDAALNDGKFAVKVGTAKSKVEETGIIRAATVELRANGGNVYALAGNRGGSINATGVTRRGGRVFLTAGKSGRVITSKRIKVRRITTSTVPKLNGGDIFINADFASIAGLLDASGEQGGNIDIAARAIHNYGAANVAGSQEDGGTIKLSATDSYLAIQSSFLDARGHKDGGLVSISSGDYFFSSGDINASGQLGHGGLIDLNASTMRFASGSVLADGGSHGGTITIGGTKNNTVADTIFADGFSKFSATASDVDGKGGSITFWSNQETAVGSVLDTQADARGGFMEVSGHQNILFGGIARGEQLLLDPKFILIDATAAATFQTYTIQDPNNSGASGRFGRNVASASGKLLITDPGDDAAASDAGAVYIFNEQTRALVSTITGNTTNDFVGNGGVSFNSSDTVAAIRSLSWDNTGAADAGAVTFVNLTSGNFLGTSTAAHGVVSDGNSIVGSTTNDLVGSDDVSFNSSGTVAAVRSAGWSNTGAADAGAVTFVNLTSGNFLGTSTAAHGVVSDGNSIVGSAANDFVGSNGVFFNSSGAVAAVGSVNWDNTGAANAGAVTFVNLTSGNFLGTSTAAHGVVSDGNSIVGSAANDSIGNSGVSFNSGGTVAAIRSRSWNNAGASDAGAVTFVNLTSGNFLGTSTAAQGVVSDGNSIVGSTAFDVVGNSGVSFNSGGTVAAIRSRDWNNTGATRAGAVTFVNLTSGNFLGTSTTAHGVVSGGNSIVGSATNDNVGSNPVLFNSRGTVAAIRSTRWNNTGATRAGAVTFVNLTSGNFLGTSTAAHGVVSDGNSIVGSTANDDVGNDSVSFNSSGTMAAIRSFNWNNTGAAQAGAVTLVDLTSGNFLGTSTAAHGVVSDGNSIVGSTANDFVGSGGVSFNSSGTIAVVRSPNWDNTGVANAGAVTFVNFTSGNFLGTSTAAHGVVSDGNSIAGSTANSFVGGSGVSFNNSGTVAAIRSSSWDNTGVANAGAVTFVNLTSGNFLGTSTAAHGVVSSGNSIVGGQANDFGSAANDFVGNGGVSFNSSDTIAAIRSLSWSNAGDTDAGAVTFVNLTSGNFLGTSTAAHGVVSSGNSIVGSTAFDFVGSGGVSFNSSGTVAAIGSRDWSNTGAADAGAVTFVNLTTGNFLGTSTAAHGVVSSGNSIVGSTANDSVGSNGIFFNSSNTVAAIRSSHWDNTGAADAGAVTFVNLTSGNFLGTSTAAHGVVSSGNSIVGSTTNDLVGNDGVSFNSSGTVAAIRSVRWNNTGAADAGAVTFVNLTSGNFLGTSTAAHGVVSSGNSIVGDTANDFVGLAGVSFNSSGTVAAIRSHDWNNTGAAEAGAVTFVNLTSGNFLGTSTAAYGVVSSGNSEVGTVANQNFGILSFTSQSGQYLYFAGNHTKVVALDLNGFNPGDYQFSSTQGSSVSVSANTLAATLSAGTSVTLQANSNITVGAQISANNTSGDGGNLTLQAGRSLIVNAGIASDGGNVMLIANELLANGVVDSERDAGDAAITLANGVDIDAGTGAVTLELRDGAGKTNRDAGDITFAGNNTVKGSAISILNHGGETDNDVNLGAGTVLNASDAGNAIVVSANSFTNNAGTGAFNLTGGGRALVYSDGLNSIQRDGLTGNNLYNRAYASNLPASISQSGNQFIYAAQPTLTITGTNTNVTYDGTAQSLSGFTVAGLVNGDTQGQVLTTNPTLGSLTNAATYTSGLLSGGMSDIGYAINLVQGQLAINKKALTITANNDNFIEDGRVYSGGAGVVGSGFVSGEGLTDLAGTLIFAGTSQGSSTVGTYTIAPSGLNSSNYALTFVDGSLTISTPTAAVEPLDPSFQILEPFNGVGDDVGNGFVGNICLGSLLTCDSVDATLILGAVAQ